MQIIKNAKVHNGQGFIPVSAIAFEDGVVKQLFGTYDGDAGIDAEGAIICPGFVDTHIHGSFGTDVLNKGGTAVLADKLPSVGTTAFCPTSATDTFENIRNFLGEVKEEITRIDGARILGAHIEGPFFTVTNRGAHATEKLRDPTVENYEEIVGNYGDMVARLSLAPEKPGGMELISALAAEGIVLSAAHTDADAKDIEEALCRGLTIATHTFNGFFPVHHRQENGIAAVLTDDRMICEFIPDLQHISKYAAKLILAAKGYEKTFICSDALEPAHMPDGDYMLAGQAVKVKNAVATIAEDGRLAGSTISVLMGVKNLVNVLGVTVENALRLGTYNPAQAIGAYDLGKIAVGAPADILVLGQDLSLQRTYIRGKLEYSI